MKIILAAVGAVLTLAVANPAAACGGGHAYRGVSHQVKAVVVPAVTKAAKTEIPPAAASETTESIGAQSALPSLEKGSRI
jgi:hypothetical protein